MPYRYNYFLIPGFLFLYLICCTSEIYASLQSSDDWNRNRIQPWSENPAYWQYKGEPILLIGGSSNDNMFQIDNLIDEIDRLVSYGGNYLRNTMASYDPGNEYAFYFDEDIQLYDLRRWNDVYWDNLDAFLQATHERGIIVQLEIWETYDFYSRPTSVVDGKTAWERNPFNPRNNINYTERNSGLYEQFRSTHGTLVNPFFYTVLPLPEPFDFSIQPTVLAYQQKFVDKVMSIGLKYDHVLYVIDNETNADPKWPLYWAQYIKKVASEQGKQIEVTEMWDTFDPTDGNVEGARVQNPSTHFFTRRASVANTLYDPDNYSYLDISNHNFQEGEMHYKTGLYVWKEIQKSGIIRPVNNTKIYGADDIGWATHQEGAERFWRNLFAGAASVRFHRPPHGLGHRDIAMAHIQSMRMMSEAVDIMSMIPRNDLLGNREENEAYCLAKAGDSYAVVFLDGGQVSLDITGPGMDNLNLKWLDVRKSEWISQADFTTENDRIVLRTPEKQGFWVAVLSKMSR